MAKLDINQPFDVYGQFWTADRPDKCVSGRVYRTSSDMKIQMFEDLRPEPRYIPRHKDQSGTTYAVVPSPDVDEPLTIYGTIGGMVGPITALNCVTLRSTSDMFNRGPAEYIICPLTVIFGAHTTGAEQCFTGVRIRTRDIDEWASLPGFSISHEESGNRSISCECPESESVTLRTGAVLSLRQKVITSTPNFRGGCIRREVWLEVTGLSPAPWSEIGRQIVTPLSSLISLCVGEANRPTSVQLLVDDGPWVQLGSTDICSREPSSRLKALATLPHFGLSGVAAWLDKAECLGPLPPVVAHFAVNHPTTKLETELLEMATVAEGLHSRLYPRAERFDTDTCEQIRTRVLNSISGMDSQVSNVLRGMLTHLREPGYERRLRDLANSLADTSPEVCGNTSKWATEVSKARNMYAHRSAGFIEDSDVDILFTIIESLRWVLRCVLLRETRIDDDILSKQIYQSSSYRVFIRRARENLPSVYGQSRPKP